MGAALGYAVTLPWPPALAIVLALGLGLALPFLAISVVPGLARRLPRPGRWMETLKQGFAFPMFATAAWLVWVLGRSLDTDAIATLLGFLWVVAFLCWLLGRLQSRGRAPGLLWVAPAAVAVLVLGLGAVKAPDKADGGTDAWSPVAVTAELRDGRPTFVIFTADWCITCKVNESLVLESAAVRQELRRLDFAVFEADWTRRDAQIGAELARYGRSGVPLYLVFSPGSPGEPTLLPEVLTVERVLEALRQAANEQESVTAVTGPEARPSMQGSV